MENIHPIFDKILDRQAKEKLLNQYSVIVWMVGLSGSGKSTIAQNLEKKLYDAGFATMLLDGDNVRSGLNNNLSFTEEDRQENQRRVAEVAKLFMNAGLVTLCSFVSPTYEAREKVKAIIGPDNFLEVYVECSFDACARRDVKGLYAKALNGEIKNFTGLDAPFEKPKEPWLTLNTEEHTIEESVNTLFNKLIEKIRYSA